MSISKGLKRIVDVIFWPWIILGFVLLIYSSHDWQFIVIIFFIFPSILRFALFYIINGFSGENK